MDMPLPGTGDVMMGKWDEQFWKKSLQLLTESTTAGYTHAHSYTHAKTQTHKHMQKYIHTRAHKTYSDMLTHMHTIIYEHKRL